MSTDKLAGRDTYCATREECKILVFFAFWTISPQPPPVMSFCVIAEIWLHKENHYQKYFRERTSLVLGLRFEMITVIHDNIVHVLNFTGLLNS